MLDRISRARQASLRCRSYFRSRGRCVFPLHPSPRGPDETRANRVRTNENIISFTVFSVFFFLSSLLVSVAVSHHAATARQVFLCARARAACTLHTIGGSGFRRATIIFPSIISAFFTCTWVYYSVSVCVHVYILRFFFFSTIFFFFYNFSSPCARVRIDTCTTRVLCECVRERCMEMAIIWRLPLNETGRLGHHDIRGAAQHRYRYSARAHASACPES